MGKNKKKIYILSPNFKTGGVECLHQLADILFSKGFNAGIVYEKKRKEALYPQYNHLIFEEIEDSDKNILVVPEVWPTRMEGYTKIKKFIWWLSFDNAPLEEYIFNLNYFTRLITRIIRKIMPKTYRRIITYLFINRKLHKKYSSVKHICQSFYVKDILEGKGYETQMLEDYIFYEKIKKSKKQDIVLYNPKKGIKTTKEVILKNKEVVFIPLENLDKKGIYDLLSKAKIYIDFGEHPGRDKIPREAVLHDCIIITNMNGSAGNIKDVPTPYRLKKVIPYINNILKENLKNYSNNIKKFKNYKNLVLNSKKTMESQATKIFS